MKPSEAFEHLFEASHAQIYRALSERYGNRTSKPPGSTLNSARKAKCSETIILRQHEQVSVLAIQARFCIPGIWRPSLGQNLRVESILRSNDKILRSEEKMQRSNIFEDFRMCMPVHIIYIYIYVRMYVYTHTLAGTRRLPRRPPPPKGRQSFFECFPVAGPTNASFQIDIIIIIISLFYDFQSSLLIPFKDSSS